VKKIGAPLEIQFNLLKIKCKNKMKNVIKVTESDLRRLVKRIICEQKELEEEYPVNWDVEEFKKLKSFNQRVQYCQDKLQRISSGSSRIAYKIDETKVLKLAKNKKGIAQNEAEINYSQDYMMDDIVAQIFNYDENGLWLEMELARKVTPTSFKKIADVTFENYTDAVLYYRDELKRNATQHKKTPPVNMDEMWNNEFVSRIFDLMGSYDNFMSGDLLKLSTYGLVTRDNQDIIVLIDYGLTEDVYNTHYK
jgi:hypothetical protein